MKRKTQRLSTQNACDVSIAASLLLQGKLVAIPTETVYGLAASALNEDAISAVFRAKKRPVNHPLILHIGDTKQLKGWVAEICVQAQALMKQYWPGPLTIIFKKSNDVSPLITGGRETIAIRMPDNPAIRELLTISGPVVAPSANLHKKLSPTSAQQVFNGLDGRIDAVLDGGPCNVGLESTIVDITQQPVRVLRAGPIYPEAISNTLQQKVVLPAQHNEAVAGNMPAHYQPQTKAKLLDTETLITHLGQPNSAKVAVLHYSEINLPQQNQALVLPLSRSEYGQRIYQALADADTLGCEQLWIEHPPEHWHEVNDRLRRACFDEPEQ